MPPANTQRELILRLLVLAAGAAVIFLALAALSRRRPLQRTEKKPGLLLRLLLFCAKAIVVLYLAIDAIFAPLFRPLFRWIVRIVDFMRLQDLIAAMPPYAILVSLAVPFGIAEPAKLIALYLIAAGHFKAGVIMTVLAHLLTLVVVERIYHAGRAKLWTIGWFAKLMEWLIGIRDRLLAWARSTKVWRFIQRVKRNAALLAQRLKRRFRTGRAF